MCRQKILGYGLLALSLITLQACGGKTPKEKFGRYHQAHDSHPHPRHIPNIDAIPNAVPKMEALSKYGNPKTYVVLKRKYAVLKHGRNYKQRGFASWYGTKFHGHRTSSGEAYDMYAMTAAHKTLPVPTYAEIKNLDNGRKIIVRINDRGPFHANRLVDLSYSAAAKLGILAKGTGRVEVTAIDPRDKAQYLKTARTITQAQSPIYIRLGSFRQKQSAESLKLKVGKISPYPISIFKLKNTALFRVSMGPFKTQAEALKVSKLLAKVQIKNPIIIQP